LIDRNAWPPGISDLLADPAQRGLRLCQDSKIELILAEPLLQG
jgi:hypothetical protein